MQGHNPQSISEPKDLYNMSDVIPIDSDGASDSYEILATLFSSLLLFSPPLSKISSSSSFSVLSTPSDSEYESSRFSTSVADERTRDTNEQTYNHHFLENFDRSSNRSKRQNVHS